MNDVFKSAGLKLFLVVDDDHLILVVVVVFEAGHADGSLSCFLNPIKTGSVWGFSTASTLPACAPLQWRRSRNGKGVAVPGLVIF